MDAASMVTVLSWKSSRLCIDHEELVRSPLGQGQDLEHHLFLNASGDIIFAHISSYDDRPDLASLISQAFSEYPALPQLVTHYSDLEEPTLEPDFDLMGSEYDLLADAWDAVVEGRLLQCQEKAAALLKAATLKTMLQRGIHIFTSLIPAQVQANRPYAQPELTHNSRALH